MKKIRYALEAFILYALFFFFKCLPANAASAVGGAIGRFIGPKLAANRKARRHLLIAFPGISYHEQTKIIKAMWNNLGRLVAEYPHLEQIGREKTEIVAPQSFHDALKQDKPIIFIGGHIGNWEVNSAATLTQYNHAVDATYRAPNNPWTDKLISRARSLKGQLKAYPKSSLGGRMTVKALKNNNSVGILIDQKYNEGIDAPFYGVSAMTNPAFIQLAQKYDCQLFPIRNERLDDGCSFRLTVYDPIMVKNESNEKRDAKSIITQAHTLMEKWISERPEQWIWLHRRWKDLP